MENGLNEQLVNFITELIRKELDTLFKSRDDNIDRLNSQVQELIKNVERISMELESRNAWNRSIKKYDYSPTKPSETSPNKKKVMTKSSFKRLPQLDPTDESTKRNEDGKLVFAKNLPRVAHIDKSPSAFVNQLSIQSQKQKIFEQAFVRYPECRSTVFAPSSWNPRTISLEQLELPNMQIQLKHVHGYHTAANSNVFYLASGELIWFTATVVVMYSRSKLTQSFYSGHSKEITAMSLHPQMQIVASGQCGKDGATILLWDSKRAKQEPTHILAKLEGQTVNIRSLSFSHDGKLIASLGGDLHNTICIHNWEDETLLVKARGHSAKVWTIAFNPYQAYGIPDKTKCQAKLGKKRKWETRSAPGQALRDEEACYTLVSCGMQHIIFWTLTQVEYTPPSNVAKEESAFYGSSFGGPNRIRQPTPHEKVWKLEGNPPLMKSEAQDFISVSFSNDNIPLRIYDEASDSLTESMTELESTLGRVVAGTAKGDLYVFWQPRRTPNYSHLAESEDFVPRKWWELPVSSWQMEGDLILEHVHFESTAKLVEIIPHDIPTGNKFKISRHALLELQDLQQRLALKPDAKPVLDRIAAIEYKGQLAHSNTCTQVVCDGKSRRIASAGSDGKIFLWSCEMLDPIKANGTHTLGIYTTLSTAPSDGRHKLHCEQSIQVPVRSKVTSLCLSGDTIVAGFSNHSIWEYDCISGEWTVVQESCEGSILGGVLVEEQNELITTTNDGLVRCWDMSKDVCVQSANLKSTGACVEIHPNQRELVVGCISGELVLLSYPELSERRNFRVLGDAISVLKFSPDGAYLAVGAKDNCMHLYETETYKRISKCEGHSTYVSHIDWSIDRYLLQTNSMDGEILYWQVAPSNVVRQITDSIIMRDILWDRWSCVYGWPVQGVWGENSSNNDISAVLPIDVYAESIESPRRTEVHHVLVAHRNNMKSFRWPCMKSAQSYSYPGHSANISCILKWKKHHIVTLGGADGTIMQWVAIPNEQNVEQTYDTPTTEEDIQDEPYTENESFNSMEAASPSPPPRSAENNRPRTPRQIFLKEELRDEDDVYGQEPQPPPPDEIQMDTSPKAEEPVQSIPVDTIECGRAIYDFQGENPDELSMKEGEVIRIVEKKPGDWWLGEACDGTRGIFPHNYIEIQK